MPPVKVSQKITEDIIKEASEGKDAVIKVEGYVIFVPTDKIANDTITVEIIKVLDKYAFAVEVNKEVDDALR